MGGTARRGRRGGCTEIEAAAEGEEDREEIRIIEGIIVVVIVGTEATGGETITAIETETTEEDDEGGRGRDRETKEAAGETITTMATMAEEKGVVEVVKERRAVLA